MESGALLVDSLLLPSWSPLALTTGTHWRTHHLNTAQVFLPWKTRWQWQHRNTGLPSTQPLPKPHLHNINDNNSNNDNNITDTFYFSFSDNFTVFSQTGILHHLIRRCSLHQNSLTMRHHWFQRRSTRGILFTNMHVSIMNVMYFVSFYIMCLLYLHLLSFIL